MENANPFGQLVPPNAPLDLVVQELDELIEISAMIDSRLENIDHDLIDVSPPASPEQLLHNFLDPHEYLEIDDIVLDAETIDTPPCFRNIVAYFDLNMSMNIITRKAINTIMVYQLASRDDNFVSIIRNVQVFVGSFSYTTDFTVFEDIEKYIETGLSEVVMGKPLKDLTHLEDDCSKGFISFTRLWDTYIFQNSPHGTLAKKLGIPLME
ncbi:hypothetical protein Tco_0179511 [Tanacetum coccineum]